MPCPRPIAVAAGVVFGLAVLFGSAVPAAANAAAYHAGGPMRQLSTTMQVQVETGPIGMFWSTQFAFSTGRSGGKSTGSSAGYFGMQANPAQDGGRRAPKTFIFSVWGADGQRTDNPDAFCMRFGEQGGEGATCRLLSDWREGLTYRFDLREQEPHWWSVTVTEVETGAVAEVGAVHTPAAWGPLTPDVLVYDQQYGGPDTYAKARIGTPSGAGGTPLTLDDGDFEDAEARVTCTPAACVHELYPAGPRGTKPAEDPAEDPAKDPANGAAKGAANDAVQATAAGKRDGDLAAHHAVTASGSTSPQYAPSQAVDRTANSAWRVTGAGQWWQVDLGGAARVDRVALDWDHHDVPAGYDVLTSRDGVNWVRAATTGAPGGGPVEHAFTPVQARYVRLALGAPAAGEIALWDVQVFAAAAGVSYDGVATVPTAVPDGPRAVPFLGDPSRLPFSTAALWAVPAVVCALVVAVALFVMRSSRAAGSHRRSLRQLFSRGTAAG